MERDGERWREMERDEERLKDIERDGERKRKRKGYGPTPEIM
jgi:hypothetical protein